MAGGMPYAMYTCERCTRCATAEGDTMRRTKPTTLPLGTISSGTLRTEDLLPAMLEVLEPLRLTRAERALIRQTRQFWYLTQNKLECGSCEQYHPHSYVDDCRNDAERVSDPDELTTSEREQLDSDLAELYAIADAHCLDYCYCGSTEDDGAEIGVWISWNAIDEPDSDDQMCKVAELDTGRKTDYQCVVSDHGNATLYRRAGRRWIEIWTVV